MRLPYIQYAKYTISEQIGVGVYFCGGAAGYSGFGAAHSSDAVYRARISVGCADGWVADGRVFGGAIFCCAVLGTFIGPAGAQAGALGVYSGFGDWLFYFWYRRRAVGAILVAGD